MQHQKCTKKKSQKYYVSLLPSQMSDLQTKHVLQNVTKGKKITYKTNKNPTAQKKNNRILSRDTRSTTSVGKLKQKTRVDVFKTVQRLWFLKVFLITRMFYVFVFTY